MTSEEHQLLQELRSEVKRITTVLVGDDTGVWGLTHQVRFMWRAFVIWPMCTLSAFAGALSTIILQMIFKK